LPILYFLRGEGESSACVKTTIGKMPLASVIYMAASIIKTAISGVGWVIEQFGSREANNNSAVTKIYKVKKTAMDAAPDDNGGYTYEYENGGFVLMVYKEEEGQEQHLIEYSYDSSGHKAENIWKNSDGSGHRTAYVTGGCEVGYCRCDENGKEECSETHYCEPEKSPATV